MIAYVTLSFRILSDVVVQLFVSPEDVLSNGWTGKDQVDIAVAHGSHRQHIEWRIGTINANDNWSQKVDVCASLSTWSSPSRSSSGTGTRSAGSLGLHRHEQSE